MPRVRSMPATAYNRTIATIRDYPRMMYEYERLKCDIGIKAANYDGMPKAAAGNGMEEKIIRLADLEAEIAAFQGVIETIPADMRDGIMNNILYGIRFPLNEYAQLVPSLREWQREKTEFIVRVARKLRIY
ncbi:MAG: hypothetical protein J6K99_07210 [Peptococcaceae bacterium]|nr:hypothetical protein [Peptococcaceae bacterium]